MDLETLRQKEREAFREREKVEEMLFHEIIFDLMAGKEHGQVLGSEEQKRVSKKTVLEVLSLCVKDGTNYKENLRTFAQSFDLNVGEAEYQRVDFVCKYILKKSLRKKSRKSSSFKDSTLSKWKKGVIARVKEEVRFSAQNLRKIQKTCRRSHQLPG